MKPRILLIAPDFYDYRESIATALIGQGYEVDSIAEVPKLAKGHYIRKISASLFKKLQYKRFAEFLSQENKYDRLLLIRGWMVPEDLPTLFRQKNPDAELIMYQWDSKRNNSYDHFIDQVDKSFSFDRKDCQSDPRLRYKPLFYKETLLPDQPSDGKNKHQMIFVAGYQALRYQTYMAIKKIMMASGHTLKSHIYIRKIAYLKLRLKGQAPDKSEVSFESIPTSLLKQWYNDTNVILDICNPNQSGLTMRAIETLGLGKILLTNNQWIREEPFYDPEQIFVFESVEQIKNWTFSKTQSLVDVKHLSLNEWVKDFCNDC